MQIRVPKLYRSLILNHRTQSSSAKTTQPRSSSPPACVAVCTTSFVIIRLFGLESSSFPISQGTSCSIWYFSRSATLVTSLEGCGGGASSTVYAGVLSIEGLRLAIILYLTRVEARCVTSTPFHTRAMTSPLATGAEDIPPVTHVAKQTRRAGMNEQTKMEWKV